ncbi:MAG TPA: hypothetical protein VFU36_16910 [Jatrophihabitans sp.]|nr:hypothetical protein [Jatrophihabitans sp.]
MRSRLLTSVGALALTLGGLLATAGQAAADPAHCSGWTTHPDYYSSGGISFKDGTYIRTGPYTDCTALGQGFHSQGINVHCATTNGNGVLWVYLVDTSTGVAGWSAMSALNWNGGFIADCYQ